MSEIGIKDQCFGVEVEMTGITREQAAHALADYFGTSPQYLGTGYDTWGATDPEGKVWKLMSDASIRAERKTRTGYTSNAGTSYRVEMVTPKLTYEELPKFQECIRRVRAAGAKVNSSCGIHVHVDAANHNISSSSVTKGSFFVKWFNARKRVVIPGEIFPPRKIPGASITSYVIAVPASITNRFFPGRK